MAVVRVIQPKKAAQVTSSKKAKIRVAAYCRISTDHEEQETSYEAQKTHFTNLIEGNPEWELVRIYADEESGTRVYKREEFMRMIQDCQDKKIDLVLTKSISRWARNTIDSLKYIRLLKSLGIPIIFTKEGINTMDHGGEVLITIMSSIAQQESASISLNVQMGVRYHYQEGKVCSGVYRLLGYERTREGSLTIVPHEADIVRRIYRDYLDGYSAKHIAAMLLAEGVDGTKTTVNGIKVDRHWNYEGIYQILANEKYAGKLLLQKYYTVDFLTKKVAVNKGQVPQYLVENSHEPIVPLEIYNQVQEERERRRRDSRSFKYFKDSALSHRVYCRQCGAVYRRISGASAGRFAFWRCETKVKPKKHTDVICRNKGIREDKLQIAIVAAFNRLPALREDLVLLSEQVRWNGIRPADEMLQRLKEARVNTSDNPSAGDSTSSSTVPPATDTPTDGPKSSDDLPSADTTKSSDDLPSADDIQSSDDLPSHDDLPSADDLPSSDDLPSAEEVAIREQRAIYADKVVQIRNLLDRIDAIERKCSIADLSTAPVKAACFEAEDFFRRTKRQYSLGPVTEYSEDDVIRFIERIVIGDGLLSVEFKAGVHVDIELDTVKKNR